jgi:hypothetical protein
MNVLMRFSFLNAGILDLENRQLPTNEQLIRWCGGCQCWAATGGNMAFEAINIGCEVVQLYNQFNQDCKGFEKGQTLLDHLHTLEVAPAESSKSVRQLLFRVRSGRVVCKKCWAVAAGFTVKDQEGEPTPTLNPQFKKMMSKLRLSITEASTKTTIQTPMKSKSIAVLAFLQRYMKHATDRVPCMDADVEAEGLDPSTRQRVHLDVARKIEVYDEFKLHLARLHQADVCLDNVSTVSASYFLKILRENYRVIQHKHSNFSQCYLCFLFRELKARATTELEKMFIQEHREAHYRIVYLERVEYHIIRVLAVTEPASVLSIIVDAMTKYKTGAPTLTRHVNVPGFR